MSGNASDAFDWFRNSYPAIVKHLEPFADKAKLRSDKGDYWWELRACDYYDEFRKPKIIYPEIFIAPKFTLDETALYTNNKLFFIPRNDLYLLGILNSCLTWFYLKHICSVLGDPNKRGRLELRTIFVEKIPIYAIDSLKSDDVARHDR